MLLKKTIISVLTAMAPIAAIADVTPANTLSNDSSRVIDLDEVIVVSQPKDQHLLRQQPMSSSVYGNAQLRQLNVRDLSQLSMFVPSFTMPAYGSRLTSSMYVRGIGSRINNPAVGVYADNIPLMSKAAFNNHFYMLDRVDILRGPQGTLYGQNTEGGLVRVYSKNPMTYQGTDARLSLGTGLYRDVEVAHYQRPTEQLAFSIAGFYSGQKGFIDNQNFSEKNDKTNEAGGKVRLLYQPTQQTKLDWTADYQYVNQNGFGYGELMENGEVADAATTLMNGYKRNMFTTGITLRHEMPHLIFTYTGSYQYLKDLMQMDQDYMTPDYLRLEQQQLMNAITNEMVLRSRGNNRWQHTSGMFESYQWLRTDAPVSFGDAITGPIGNAITNAMQGAMQQAMYAQMLQQMLAQGMPQQAAEAAAMKAAQAAVEKAGITMSAEMAVPERFRTPQWNMGFFHESNISPTDRLKLTLGLRLNTDKVEISYDALAYMNMTGGTAQRQATYHLTSHVEDKLSKTYTQLLPKIGITYHLPTPSRGGTGTGSVYALISKGYRMGGYNIQMFSDILQTDLNAHQQDAMRGDYDVAHTGQDRRNIEETISYKPEESWNYEAGTHLNLLGGRLHADLAVYYMQVRNQQLSVMSPDYNYGRIMVNAGKSHSCGIETTLRGSAFDNALDWGVAYSFTHAEFDEYDTYENHYVPFVPQHTFSAMGDWHMGRFSLGANVTGQGKTWWDEANTYCQKMYALLGAHADYDFGPVLISFWGRNLTNTHYNTFAIESSAAGTAKRFAHLGTPLQLGIDLRLHFH